MRDTNAILQKYFGYTEFRPLQKEIITDLMDQHDVFVLMPTGAGKSLCYQIPALVQPGLTIVVSPLIALMKDQVDGLVHNGIPCAYLNSSLTHDEQSQIKKRLQENELSLLYVAPERLMQEHFLEYLKQLPVTLFAIDEAHCISEWGHDFRKEYRELRRLRDVFPGVPIIALTATATPRVKADIVTNLQLQQAKHYQASFNRPNLHYVVRRKNRVRDQVLEYVKNHSGESGIIYCQSRDKVDETAAFLTHHGIRALPYHAGLSDNMRQDHQEQFLRDDIDIIVATIAFGMGIDKPDVRFVIHADLPSNIERYYQETGRAGRDGLPSECLLLYSPGDKASIEYFIQQKDEKEQINARNLLRRMTQFAQTTGCRRKQLLSYFDEEWMDETCASCDNCIAPPEIFDGTVLAQKVLSCVYRLNQRFGARYVADILLGSQVQKIIQNGHNNLSTYGIVTDYGSKELLGYIQELIELGYIHQQDGQYPTLQLTEKSKAVLKGEEKVFLHKLQIKEKRQRIFVGSDSDYQLFDVLRTLRKKLADERKVPPYIIFSDVTLKEMVSAMPKNKDEFALIKGVGKQKLVQYADTFLSEIQKFEQKHK